MERDRRRERSEDEAAPKQSPAPVAGILALQQSAGNAAVSQLLRAPGKAKAITGVTVNHEKVTVPPDAALDLKAQADPKDAGGDLTYGVEGAGATLDGATKADPKTGQITVGAKQAGGKAKATVKQKITAEDGSFTEQPAERELFFLDEPGAITATSESSASTKDVYQGDFTHTFKAGPGGAAGLEMARVNERFGGPLIKDSMSANHDIAAPWGTFKLKANPPADPAKGWLLNGSGEMTTPDHVSIEKDLVDARPFVKNASQPTAKGLPSGFEVQQDFYSVRYPGKTFTAAAVATTAHKRTLRAGTTGLEVALEAGGKEVVEDYAGPTAFRNATASKPTVEPSTKDDVKTVDVSVEAVGKDAKPTYSIQGEKLGCKVDSAGKVTIGTKPGTITVRAGDTKSYDEVTITIKAPAAAAAKPTAETGEGSAALAEPPSE
jgi:hypothetical protein